MREGGAASPGSAVRSVAAPECYQRCPGRTNCASVAGAFAEYCGRVLDLAPHGCHDDRQLLMRETYEIPMRWSAVAIFSLLLGCDAASSATQAPRTREV